MEISLQLGPGSWLAHLDCEHLAFSFKTKQQKKKKGNGASCDDQTRITCYDCLVAGLKKVNWGPGSIWGCISVLEHPEGREQEERWGYPTLSGLNPFSQKESPNLKATAAVLSPSHWARQTARSVASQSTRGCIARWFGVVLCERGKLEVLFLFLKRVALGPSSALRAFYVFYI